ncbi:hypothetical protein L1987_59157 [Smallanthus sonchifolius]|uniref:Uncharacterized protein n=1 Tax=Smallanthus sonchifolius TaxID=185202 RepID=A0ACB9D510_9ASTR|nr:hypothetical protein L1987_59157 [Smallanthus sonchifolius]
MGSSIGRWSCQAEGAARSWNHHHLEILVIRACSHQFWLLRDPYVSSDIGRILNSVISTPIAPGFSASFSTAPQNQLNFSFHLILRASHSSEVVRMSRRCSCQTQNVFTKDGTMTPCTGHFMQLWVFLVLTEFNICTEQHFPMELIHLHWRIDTLSLNSEDALHNDGANSFVKLLNELYAKYHM